jgi:hypothetical protein
MTAIDFHPKVSTRWSGLAFDFPLDAHGLLWWFKDDDRLGSKARDFMQDPAPLIDLARPPSHPRDPLTIC